MTTPANRSLTDREIDTQIGRSVRIRRMQLAISQETLGTALGVTFQQIQKYEKGSNRISGSKLLRIAGILAVPVSYFFQGIDQAQASPVRDLAAEFCATPDGLRLAEAFLAIGNPTARHALAMLAVTMAGAKSEAQRSSPTVGRTVSRP